MNEFIRMVFSELGNGIWKAIFAVLLAGGVLFYIYRMQRQKYGDDRPFPWKRSILIILLVGYLTIVEYATMSRLGVSAWSGANLQLFRAWREAWNHYSVKAWANVLLNVALFVPLGVLVPLVFPKCRKGLRMLAVGFGTTLTVEFLQWVGGHGIFDVDDLFCNTVGAMMGYCGLITVSAVIRKRWCAGLLNFALFLIPVAAVGGIFLAYEIQPYGNLTQDYVCRVDTKDVTWILECDLPEDSETAAVYRANALSVPECDEFALQFAENWGGTYDDILYYDKETYFRDYDSGDWMHYLTVSHLDGSYEFWAESNRFDWQTARWATLDREALEMVLSEYGIEVPQEAEFRCDGEEAGYYSHDNGWYCFRADQIVADDRLLHGTLYCRLSDDGAHITIHNRLISYAYCADEEIISAEEAFRLLCDGYFNGEWFERRKPARVSVQNCTLGYEIDTKGFYQPVYYFEVMAPQWDGPDTVLISAMK